MHPNKGSAEVDEITADAAFQSFRLRPGVRSNILNANF